MLLAIDIGNTDFTIGVFQGKKLCDTFRMRTKINRTSDELRQQIRKKQVQTAL